MKKSDKLWDIYLKCFELIEKNIWLWHWNIAWEWVKDKLSFASVELVDYSQYKAKIEFNNDIIYWDDQETFEIIFKVFVHEYCHIMTWAGTNYLMDRVNKINLLQLMIHREYTFHLNAIITQEEMLTWILDWVVLRIFLEMKEYKDLEKSFNKITKK